MAVKVHSVSLPFPKRSPSAEGKEGESKEGIALLQGRNQAEKPKYRDFYMARETDHAKQKISNIRKRSESKEGIARWQGANYGEIDKCSFF